MIFCDGHRCELGLAVLAHTHEAHNYVLPKDKLCSRRRHDWKSSGFPLPHFAAIRGEDWNYTSTISTHQGEITRPAVLVKIEAEDTAACALEVSTKVGKDILGGHMQTLVVIPPGRDDPCFAMHSPRMD